MEFDKLNQIILNQTTVIKPFNCKEEDLNGFLFDDAKNYEKELLATTFLLEDPQRNLTVAYYSLLSDKIVFNPSEKTIWNKINRSIPNNKRRRNYPAVKIGRLAVNENFSNKGVGTFILDNIKITFTHIKRIGCRFLTVDALTSATDFYLKNGFQFFTESDKEEDTRLMFFDLKNFVL